MKHRELVSSGLMVAGFGTPPLVRWDGVHLVVHLPAIEDLLRDRLGGSPYLADPRLSGTGDVIQLTLTVRWKGLSSRVRVEVHEVRVKMRRLGFRLGRMRVLGGVRIPRLALERAVARAAPDLVRVFPGSGVVVVDLRRWIPEEADLKVVAVQVLGRKVHFWLGPGSVTELPADGRKALDAGSEAGGNLPSNTA